ncbi:ABC transporter ATP-binding protein [Oscillibacter sp.]|uniref:ABC transporter ATP-binding protein n=1 Tax=Oscillibacter sp. TaxID=1945593 RepID=UPI0028A9F4AD|nr:ABC transporter ATP-binding protein [Oscillibacter sp.]
MIKQILNTLTPKGRGALLSAVAWFTLYSFSGIGTVLLVLRILSIVTSGSGDSFVPYWWGLVMLLLVRGFSNAFGDMRKHFAGFDLNYELRTSIVHRMKGFSLGFYTNERLGEVSTIVHKDVDNMVMVVGHLWPRMLSDIIVSVVVATTLLVVNWKLGLLMLSVLPIALGVLFLGLKRGSELETKNGNHLADMVSLFVEYVKGIPLLKAFSDSRQLDAEIEKRTREFGESSKQLSRYKAKLLSYYGAIVDLAFGVMSIAGMVFVFYGKLELMTYFLYIIVSKEFYKPFSAMETYWMNYLTVIDSYRRIRRMLDVPIVMEPEHARSPVGANIAFCDVGFSYEEHDFELKKISFRVPEGTITALVGESGSGKTTATNLLLRFWDVDSGSIQIGGVDIRDMSYDDLLDSISIVMQSVQLFADTVENNIRIGKANASREEIVAAAKRARVHDFILSLPQGYQTPISENGATLSGGQRQRLSIARAFLKDSPILVLDEFTSNVDPGNETLIQEAISELAKGRTVLVIAHRLSTIRTADQILVFKKGEIIEQGNHEELMRMDGQYSRLFRVQSAAL